MLEVIEQLDDERAVPIGSVIQATSRRMDEEMVRTLVAMLVTHDLVAITV